MFKKMLDWLGFGETGHGHGHGLAGHGHSHGEGGHGHTHGVIDPTIATTSPVWGMMTTMAALFRR